jgi:rare lipoprotein A
LLEVTNIANGKSVVVKVNDTGLFKGKKLDLSKGAFSKIANLKQGVIKIKVEKFNNKMNDLYYESTYEIQQLNNDELELYLKTI